MSDVLIGFFGTIVLMGIGIVYGWLLAKLWETP